MRLGALLRLTAPIWAGISFLHLFLSEFAGAAGQVELS
jgi:hypothetical protein